MLYNFKIIAILITLTIISYTDIKYRIIPDKVLICSAIVGLILNILTKELSMLSIISGSILGGGFLLSIALLTKGGIGGGDIKLMAVMGLFLGVEATLIALCISFVLVGFLSLLLLLLRFKDYKDTVVLGPYFSIGIISSILYLH